MSTLDPTPLHNIWDYTEWIITQVKLGNVQTGGGFTQLKQNKVIILMMQIMNPLIQKKQWINADVLLDLL